MELVTNQITVCMSGIRFNAWLDEGVVAGMRASLSMRACWSGLDPRAVVQCVKHRRRVELTWHLSVSYVWCGDDWDDKA